MDPFDEPSNLPCPYEDCAKPLSQSLNELLRGNSEGRLFDCAWCSRSFHIVFEADQRIRPEIFC